MTATASADQSNTAPEDKLTAAKIAEKEAQRLRREGRDAEAVAMYNNARDLYADSEFAHDDNDLGEEVLRAIKRCDATMYNIRHPKEVRPVTVTPRPSCLYCSKPLRRFAFDGQTFKDGTPREWGSYGDNRFCGLRCGWNWACQHSALPTKKARP